MMAADVSAEVDSINPCCALWRAKYIKLENKRKYLREGVQILKEQIDRVQNEKQNIEKELNEEQARADAERKEKEKESSLRVSLEQEVAALKLEISSTQQEGGSQRHVDEEVMILKAQASECQLEIDQLKQLLEEEKTKAELGRKNADREKKKSATLEQTLESEKTRADEAAKLADLEAKKVEETQVQLEVIKNELNAVRAGLSEEESRYADAMKKLDAEKQKALRERERVGAEKAKTLQQKKLAEANKEKAEEERCNANNLLKLLEEERQKVESLKEEIKTLASSHESADVINPRSDENSPSKNTLVQISEQEAEILWLKQLLEGEKEKADEERKNAEIAKNAAAELQAALESEKIRVNEKIELAYAESKRVKEYQVQLEMLRSEVSEARSIMTVEKSKCEDLFKELESEKQIVLRERRHADEEKAKSAKLRNLVEANEKKVIEESCRANKLFELLEEEKVKVDKLQKEMQVMSVKAAEASVVMNQRTVAAKTVSLEPGVQSSSLRVDDSDISQRDERKGSTEKRCMNTESGEASELRKLAEASRKRAAEERVHTEHLSQQLENSRTRIKELENELEKVKSFGKMVEGTVCTDANIMADDMKRSHLEDQLKFEKKRLKHAKEVTKLEKSRNYILKRELHQLKQDLVQMSHRMDFMDHFLCHGVQDSEKLGNLSNLQSSSWNRRPMGVKSLMLDNEFVMPNPSARGASDFLIPTGGFSHPENNTESLSGIKTKMDPLLGGSDREILSSSAINSKASFSDKKFLGSQERDAASLTTSAVLMEGDSNPQPTISTSCGEGRKRKHNDNMAMFAENTGKGPLDKLLSPCQKRRKIIESVKCIQSESKRLHEEMEEKLSQFQDLFNGLINQCTEEEKHLAPDKKCTSHSSRKGSRRKRKSSHGSEGNTGDLCGSDVQKHGDSAAAASFQLKTGIVEKNSLCKAAVGDLLRSDEDRVMSFEQLLDGDYMKLLDLDNAADEESFRIAMERPLSPSLPEIHMHDSGGGKVDLSKCLVDESGNAGVLISKKDSDKCSSLDVLDTGNCHGELECNYSRPPLDVLEKVEAPVVPSETVGGDKNGYCSLTTPQMPLVNQFSGSGVDMEALNMLISGSRLELLGGVPGSANCAAPMFCLVFPGLQDINSIARIFFATKTYVAYCHLFSETSWLVQEILAAIASNEQLVRRERTCVLFSLILHNFCFLFTTKSTHFNYKEVADFFSTQMQSVLSDMEGRRLLAELCDISELVSLFDDSVARRRILVHEVVAPELHVVESSFNVLLEGEKVLLDSKAVPPQLVIAGSIILASICSAVEQTGAVCDASINIIHLCKDDHSLMLVVLHMFAYVCGDSYFSLSHHNLSMAVVKLLVTSIEGVAETGVTTACNNQPWFHPAARCPFLQGFDSVDNVLSLLLENITSDVSNLHNMVPGAESANICSSDDIMSLLELISSFMGWDWTFNRIVQHLLKLLETCSLGNFTIITVLLGHLGRIGLSTRGSDDAGVGRIRSALSSALCRISAVSASDPSFAVATISALLGLSSGDCEETVQRLVEVPADIGQPGDRDIMRRQLSSVVNEQKSLLATLKTSALVHEGGT